MDTDFQTIYRFLIERSAEKPGPALLAIDGRCASGKSTLAKKLAEEWNAALFHMDDFYLQPHQRTPERLAEPGGNVDRERFFAEVLQPLTEGKAISYRRFDCGTMSFESPQLITPGAIAIVEGSYSCHPLLRDHYDYRIFLGIDPETQQARILRRNGPEAQQRFISRWIPLEESYFSACAVRDHCELVIDNNDIG